MESLVLDTDGHVQFLTCLPLRLLVLAQILNGWYSSFVHEEWICMVLALCQVRSLTSVCLNQDVFC